MGLCDQGDVVSVSPMGPDDAVTGGGGLTHSAADLTRSKCAGNQPVIQIYQGQPADLTLYCLDRNGAPVSLATGGPFHAHYACKERIVLNRRTFDVDGTITPSVTTGQVTCSLTPTHTAGAGLFVTQLIIHNEDNQAVWHTPYWLQINPSIDASNSGPITFAEVRLLLRDVCPEQNLLLQDFEFDDSQIAACITMPIDEFNEKYQPKTTYSTKSFPYRYHWRRAACGYLLEIAARGYARDHLDYSAGGVQVQDKNKATLYMGLAKDLLNEWRQFVRDTKIEINIEGGFGSLRSAYGYTGRW